jgi:hypothetical protein
MPQISLREQSDFQNDRMELGEIARWIKKIFCFS